LSISIYTNTFFTTIDSPIKEVFMNYVLTPDDNNQVVPVNQFDQKMMNRAINLPLRFGLDEVGKKMILNALADLKENDRFMINASAPQSIEDNDAKFYLKIVHYLNDGSARTPDQAQAAAKYDFTDYNIVAHEQ